MSQVFFVWPHGGKAVSVVGNFNGWQAIPLQKQGNYFFTVINLNDGFYHYKFIVDNRWVYDIGQPHEDDGSGNWNNYLEVGAKAQKEQPQQQQQQSQKRAKEQKEQPQQQKQEQQQKGKQQREQREQKGKQNREQKEQPQQQKEQSQQQKKPKSPEPKPEPEFVAETERASGTERESEPERASEPEPEAASAPAAETPKPEKKAVSIITLEVIPSDVETDMAKLEEFVRSVTIPGIKWEGSQVRDHVFGLKKLEIILQAQDDVSVEGDVISAIIANEDLCQGASITNFAC